MRISYPPTHHGIRNPVLSSHCESQVSVLHTKRTNTRQIQTRCELIRGKVRGIPLVPSCPNVGPTQHSNFVPCPCVLTCRSSRSMQSCSAASVLRFISTRLLGLRPHLHAASSAAGKACIQADGPGQYLPDDDGLPQSIGGVPMRQQGYDMQVLASHHDGFGSAHLAQRCASQESETWRSGLLWCSCCCSDTRLLARLLHRFAVADCFGIEGRWGGAHN